jgi:hypothetical protein
MKQYCISAWFAAVVSIILIIRGVIASISSEDLDVVTLIIANIFPIILLYVAVGLLKVKERKSSATSTSVLVFIASILWLISLIPGLPIIMVTLTVLVNLLITVAALLTINWYIGRGAGLTITIVILFIGAIFVGAYGSKIFHSSSYTNNPKLLVFKGHEDKIVLPSYIPAGFEVTSAIGTQVAGDVYQYSVEYCDANKSCYSVGNACDGLGSLLGGDEEATGTSRFGTFTIELLHPGSEGNGGARDYVLSSWLPNPQQVSNNLKGIKSACVNGADNYHMLGEAISIQEAVRVVESFVPLK